MLDIHLSTIGENAGALARQYGLGVEVADFSYAVNMDTDFAYWEQLTLANLDGVAHRVLHAPYNELCPAAVEPLVQEVTRRRLDQAYQVMRHFGIHRMVVHSGYFPGFYYREWFTARSVEFWRAYLKDKDPDFQLLLENVLEEGPEMLIDIIEQTGDERLQFCLDIGHAEGLFSKQPVTDWIAATAPHIRHVHVHNNYHTGDAHNPPGDGLINIRAALLSISALQPLATYTAETSALEASVEWFLQQGFISGAKS